MIPPPPPELTAGCAIMTIALLIAILIPIIGITIFWIYMITYCIKYQKKDRAVWIIVNFLCGPLGSIIYVFLKDEKEQQKEIIKKEE